MRKFKNLVALGLVVAMMIANSMGALAITESVNAAAEGAVLASIGVMPKSANFNTYKIPGGKGTIRSNAWRSTNPTESGNTLQWDYQVSAEYTGTHKVDYIRTEWKGGASLKNGASINVGVSGTGVTVGGSSSWQNIHTVNAKWTNSNGNKTSSYRSNMVVTPKQDYRKDTISIINEAAVKLVGDNREYTIIASA